VFRVWYWQLDRGGPAEAGSRLPGPAKFRVPENAMPELASQGWAPRYPDYLYLAFTNATAFSATDKFPVRTRAKLVMMVQAAVSLLTRCLWWPGRATS
jgi:hypothetical protein